MEQEIKLLNELSNEIDDDTLTNKIYHAIIDQINTIDNKIVCINGIKHKIPHDKEIKRAALNIVLVLRKGRLAYRIDLGKELNNIIISVINSLTDQLTAIAILPTEPLIFLSVNKSLITMIFQNEKYLDTAFGKVLEYEFAKEESPRNIRQSYNVSFEASNDNETITLYQYDVPTIKYTREMTEKISEKTKLYRRLLQPYGYAVSSKVLLF